MVRLAARGQVSPIIWIGVDRIAIVIERQVARTISEIIKPSGIRLMVGPAAAVACCVAVRVKTKALVPNRKTDPESEEANRRS